MTVVIGTAGHIDHGKTALLRALTGIDADRLPEEQRRGMTLDVGYAHLRLPNGRLLDFVDVPGHDRLVGNMLVGAGEIDAAMLVVAADDGPRAQTREHLALLDGLGIRDGLAVVTKTDLVAPDRVDEVCEAVRRLLKATGLAEVPVLAASSATGAGLDAVVATLAAIEHRLAANASIGPDVATGPDAATAADPATVQGLARDPVRPAPEPVRSSQGSPRLAIDRVFTIRGRGTVVTGSLRGGGLAAGDVVRVEPGGLSARIREVQVHGASQQGRAAPGRTALNLAGVEAAALRRGQVLTSGPGIEVSNRMIVVLRRPASLGHDTDRPWPPRGGRRVRLHLGTDQVGGFVGSAGSGTSELSNGSVAVLLRLEAPVAAAVGDRVVLRQPSPADIVAGGIVLDPVPPAGPARRRITASRLEALRRAVWGLDAPAAVTALAELHGVLGSDRVAAVAAMLGPGPQAADEEPWIAPDMAEDLASTALAMAASVPSGTLDGGVPLAEVRTVLVARLRKVTDGTERLAQAAATGVLDGLVAGGQLLRDGARLRDPARVPGPPESLRDAMDRLERLLSVPAPPALADAAREADCPRDGIRALEAAGRLVRVDADLAWATPIYQQLAAQALALARRGPLSPAAFRDATGTSRRYVLAILEDLDRRGILERGPDGHRPGPRAPAAGAGGPVR
jgi:selenocysteine-specific elongation factor